MVFFIPALLAALGSVAGSIAGAVGSAAGAVGSAAGAVGSALGSTAGGVGSALGAAGGGVGLGAGVGAGVAAPAATAGMTAGTTFSAIPAAASGAVSGVTPALSQGVSSAVRGGGSIPARSLPQALESGSARGLFGSRPSTGMDWLSRGRELYGKYGKYLPDMGGGQNGFGGLSASEPAPMGGLMQTSIPPRYDEFEYSPLNMRRHGDVYDWRRYM